MTATPNPIVNLISTGDPNDWAASGGGVVAPGAPGAAFSFLIAFSVYDLGNGSLSFIDNLLANTGYDLSLQRTIDVSGEVLGSLRLRLGNGTTTESLETALGAAAGLTGNYLVGVRKDAGEIVRLYVNGARVGQDTLTAYAASTGTFGLFAGADVETAGLSSFAFLQGVLLTDDNMADIYNLWRTQGRILEVLGADLLNLGTPNWAYEAAHAAVPVATRDLSTLVNLGSVGAAGDLTTAVDHEVGVRIDQIVHPVPWTMAVGGGGATSGEAQFSSAGQAGINAANVPLEMFENTEFASSDWVITSATELTAQRTGRYRVSLIAQLTETAGVANEDLTVTVEIDGVGQKSHTETIDGTGGTAIHALDVSPFLIDIVDGEVLTVDLTTPAGNTYSLNAVDSYILLTRVG